MPIRSAVFVSSSQLDASPAAGRGPAGSSRTPLGRYPETQTQETHPTMSTTRQYEPALHVVLHHPEIPHNTGSAGRTCVAVGAKLWLVRPLGFKLDDYYLRRAGLDYWPCLEWEVVENWEELLQRLPGRYWFFSKKGARSFYDVSFERGDVLVFGNESRGLPDEILAGAGDRCVRLPMRPQIRCLNLANTVAISLYEALRQGVGPGVAADVVGEAPSEGS